MCATEKKKLHTTQTETSIKSSRKVDQWMHPSIYTCAMLSRLNLFLSFTWCRNTESNEEHKKKTYG